MDTRALSLLELPAILERLAAATASAVGAERAASLLPSGDGAEVACRSLLTSEAIALLEVAAEPALHQVADVREAATLAARGSALDPAALIEVARTIRAGVAARSALADAEAPLLAAIAEEIDQALATIAAPIERAVEEDGSGLRDAASPDLRRLRRQLRDGRARVAERLRTLARDPSLAEHLQDDFVTERGGRPVLALRASARGRVPGIVHDSSASGQTLFVEPLAVVEDSNRLREAESAEREEVTRILRTLSAPVGAAEEGLHTLVDAVARIDLALACGVLSRRWRGAQVAQSHKVVLRGARHPLLDPAVAVPIDLDLGSLRVLVISGPNTGGKTVALKTLGLAAVLHQCGLRPPADEARLPIFDQVLADIGDEQSIAMSLSTFSGHVRNLIAILDSATADSLVLLDEVAAGTDPVEGAALAQAILTRLATQARLTLVTSHYVELKEWASATEDATNAATGFEPDSGIPLYRIELGRPGSSHALRTAARLGLAPDVIADAKARIAPERLHVDALLADAEAAARAAEEARIGATAERERAAQATAEVRTREAELATEAERVRESMHAERERAIAGAEHDLTAARSELEALRVEISAARTLERKRKRAEPPEARALERDRDRRLGAASERAVRTLRKISEVDAPLAVEHPLAAGDPVTAPALGVRGTITEIHGSEAVVLGHGGLRVRVPVDRLFPDRDPAGARPRAEQAVKINATTPTEAPDELDLRGQTAQEAREAVRAFVDAAALTGRDEVRVIHGRGTGAVRKAVRDELAQHPLVDGHESDSADGATVVRLGGR